MYPNSSAESMTHTREAYLEIRGGAIERKPHQWTSSRRLRNQNKD